jgi:peptidoglycan/xylan/chitin deacetylase (PgdA/CDA1 family)
MRTLVTNSLILILSAILLAQCGLFDSNIDYRKKGAATSGGIELAPKPNSGSSSPRHPVVSSPEVVMSRKQVPILCYHQIRDFRASDSKRSRDYIVPPAKFQEQMEMLADSGYRTVLPDQLIEYLHTGQGLPEKPVMLSFDDADLSQFEVAKPLLDQYGFKAAFFIMTVVLNKPGYMKRDHIRQLSDEGHVIGSHTWDHMNVKKMAEHDWEIQIDKPSRQLREITGKPIVYFAYPFGLWDRNAETGITQRVFKAAFQLSAKRDSLQPLYSIRRIIVPGEWSTSHVHGFMKGSFR